MTIIPVYNKKLCEEGRILRKVWFSLFTVCTIMLSAIEIEPLPKNATLSDVLYVNCLQVTQEQQLLKTYILSGMSLRYKSPKKELSEALGSYEERLHKTVHFFQKKVQDKRLKSELDAVLQRWKEVRSILEKKPEKSKVPILKKHLDFISKVLVTVHKRLGKKGLNVIAVTGGLCRGPFYIANLYFMKTWGVPVKDYDKKMAKYRAEYEKRLAVLENYPKNTEEIKRYIHKAKAAFSLMNEYIKNSHKVFVPALISQKSDRNFQYILHIKNLYGKLAQH